jgi:hypothetical protein
VTRENLGGTWGHPIRNKIIVIGVGQVSKRADRFAPANLSDWYGGTLLVWLLGTVFQST